MAPALSTYIFGRDRYQVTAALVQIKDAHGRSHHLYRGAILPAGFPDETIARLLSEDMITTFGEAAS